MAMASADSFAGICFEITDLHPVILLFVFNHCGSNHIQRFQRMIGWDLDYDAVYPYDVSEDMRQKSD